MARVGWVRDALAGRLSRELKKLARPHAAAAPSASCATAASEPGAAAIPGAPCARPEPEGRRDVMFVDEPEQVREERADPRRQLQVHLHRRVLKRLAAHVGMKMHARAHARGREGKSKRACKRRRGAAVAPERKKTRSAEEKS